MPPDASRPSAAAAHSATRLAAVKRLEMVVAAAARRAGPDSPAGGVPGFAIGVLQGDDLLLRQGVGLASIEHGVAITPATRFRIASVSKQFTCAAILLLAREDKLSLDDDVRSLLPGRLPKLKDLPSGALSLRRLMHMSSGLRDYLTMLRAGGVELDQALDGAALDALIDRHEGLNFDPNTRFLYCNTNYRLLGQVVEKVSGFDLATFLQRHFFEPLGMGATAHTPDPAAIEGGLASAYLQRPDAQGRMDPRGLHWARAAQAIALGGEGGLVSSLDDLLVWARALRSPPRGLEFLPRLLRETLAFEHGAANVYARGQEVLRYRGLTTIGHSGLWPGYRTELLLVPEREIAIVVIANDSGVNPHVLARRLLDALLWEQLGRPSAAGKPPAPGLYFAGDEAGLERGRGGAGLLVEIGGPNPLHGNAPTLTLFSGQAPLRCEPDDANWWAAEAGAIVLKIRQTRDGIALCDDAGDEYALRRLERAAALPAALQGAWRCRELDCTWTFAGAAKGEMAVNVVGPVAAGVTGWKARPIAGPWIEIVAAGRWLPASFTARLDGDVLLAHTARARHLRFERVRG